jgi:hypothetical protein
MRFFTEGRRDGLTYKEIRMKMYDGRLSLHLNSIAGRLPVHLTSTGNRDPRFSLTCIEHVA